MIQNVSCNGEKWNWKFKMLITLDQKNRQILEEYGKLVPSAKEVWHWIDGINQSNQRMATALPTLHATKNLYEDFQAASGSLWNFVAANKSENQTRNISEIWSGGRDGAGRGHSEGQNSGWSCGHWCGGQNYSKKEELFAQSYTTQEWGQLMYEQKESVQKLRWPINNKLAQCHQLNGK